MTRQPAGMSITRVIGFICPVVKIEREREIRSERERDRRLQCATGVNVLSTQTFCLIYSVHHVQMK